MEKLKVMIDLDETIVSPGYLEVVNKYMNTNYKYEDIDSYYVEDVLDPKTKDRFLDWFYENINVYDYATVMPDAIDVIRKLNDKYDLYIVSAFVDKRRPMKSKIMASYKYGWIRKNLSFIDPKHIVLTSAKNIIMCDIKIDDKFSNLKGYGKIKLLLDHMHNRKYTFEELNSNGITRVLDWKQIESILLGDENNL